MHLVRGPYLQRVVPARLVAPRRQGVKANGTSEAITGPKCAGAICARVALGDRGQRIGQAGQREQGAIPMVHQPHVRENGIDGLDDRLEVPATVNRLGRALDPGPQLPPSVLQRRRAGLIGAAGQVVARVGVR
jgi:hypothetical protein